MFILASAFDFFFGGKDAFYDLNAIKALWKLSCILGILFLLTGVFRFRKSRDANALIGVIMRALICGSLMLPFCRMAETLKVECIKIKAATGFTPEEMNFSLHRIAKRTEQAYKEKANDNPTSSWFDLAAKATDSIGQVVLTNMIAGITAVAWLAALILKFFYLIHDFVFYSAILISPLAFGLVGSSFFDTRRGIQFIFTVLGVAIWPLCWLFVDAIVLMALKPLDPSIGGSTIIQNDAKFYAAYALDGTGGMMTTLVLMAVITAMIFFGYIMSIRLAHWVFGSIGGGIIEMAGNMVRGAAATARNVALAKMTGGASLAAGGAGAAAGSSGAAIPGMASASPASGFGGTSGGSMTLGTSNSGGGQPFQFKPQSAGQRFATLKGSVPPLPKPQTSNWRTNKRVEAENKEALS